MLEFLFICSLVIVCVPAFFILVLLSCIVTGSSVDPDDKRTIKIKRTERSMATREVEEVRFTLVL